MKLVTVLMLVALPLYCYAGSGCAVLEEVVEETIDPSLSTTEYLAAIREYVSDDATAKAAVELKQCFLNQSNETLNNIRVMQVISIFGSEDYRERSEINCLLL
ncbi:PREDICTED: mammaglobin-A-like [Ceratotherium simum simum]|uniref:Mammaglobin-A-like n=1 Tax=Ceratotherium simum simum TaxID=73337 RepID=A0ABM1D9Z7_CERSS|nr:PREDICTED: mammaglobin-A-like [Ceratotherium simum simum]